jgi:putative ABC transport system permease protein
MFKLLRRITCGRTVDSDLREEIETHRALRQQDLERSGISSEEAARASRRALGNVTLAREDARAIWIATSVERLRQDVRYGGRTLRKNPAFTAVAVIMLALGICGSTTMFSVVNTILLRPLPYADPDRVVMIWTRDLTRDINQAATSYPTFTDWRRDSRRLVDLAIWRTNAGNVIGGIDPERVAGAFASANLLPLLGVRPAIGRTFTSEEEQRREPVVVLSHRLWERRFGASPGALGQTLEIDGHRMRVIGVMPTDFYFPTRDVEHWEPATLIGGWALKPAVAERSWHNRYADLWNVVGRLDQGSSVRDAQSEMTGIGRKLLDLYPSNDPEFVGFDVEIVPVLEQVTGRHLGRALWILLGSVGFVLLIACANVANLLLARSASRTRELAVRAALGAGRGRLLRQLFTENAMVAFFGGCLGACGAAFAVRALPAAMPGIPRLDEVALDSRVLAFTASVSMVAGLLFGVVPACRASHGNPGDALKGGVHGSAQGMTMWWSRGALVIVECTLAVTLLAGAGVLIRSLLAVQTVDPGFDASNVLLARVNLPIPVSREWRRQEWETWKQLNERLGQLPGVASAGAITSLLVDRRAEEAITVEGQSEPSAAAASILVNTEDVTPEFFRAMGVPLLRGRFFTYEEHNAPVAIVNEAFARQFFPGVEPIGKRFREGGPAARRAWNTVVGVVANMRREGLERRPVPEFFFPSSEPVMDIVVRSASSPTDLAPALREIVRSVYPHSVIIRMTTVAKAFGDLGAQRRFQTWLLALFAFVALALSAVGVYGLMHFAVAQRTHELGVRVALGATARDIRGFVIRQGLCLPAIGLALGLAIAFALTRLLSHLMFEVSPHDPLTYTGVAVLLMMVALGAVWLPARRAARVDPITALRGD